MPPSAKHHHLIVSIACTLVWLCLGIVSTIAPAQALNVDISVFEVADSALAAKDKAMARAPELAFAAFAKNGVASTRMSQVQSLFKRHESRVVESFFVLEEKTGPTSYQAKLRYSLRLEMIVELLASANISFVNQDAPPILVVPYERRAGKLVFDASAPWYQLWAKAKGQVGRFTFYLPKRPDELALFDVVTLEMPLEEQSFFLGSRFGVWSVSFAIYDADAENPQVSLIGEDAIGRVNAQFKLDGLRGAPEAGLPRAFESATTHLQDRWKDAAAQPMAAMSDVVQRVRMPLLNGLVEWPRLEIKLRAISGVRRVDLKMLEKDFAEAELLITGEIAAFMDAALVDFIVLEGQDGVLVMQPLQPMSQ